MNTLDAQSVSTETIKRLLSNALEQFSASGYEAVSVRDITRASAVTKPTLYYYFENKEGLYRQLVKQSVDELLNLLKQSIDRGESSAQRAYSLLKEHLLLCEKKPSLVRFVYNLVAQRTDPLAHAEFERFNRGLREMISQIIARAAQTGEIQPLAQPFVETSMRALIQCFVTDALASPGVDCDFNSTEGVVNYLFAGLRA